MELFAKLGIDLPLLISQLVCFLVLLVVLYFAAYRKVVAILDERSKIVKDSLEEAQNIKEKSAKMEEEIKAKIAEAGKKGQDIINRAAQTGEQVKYKAQEQARIDADKLISKAKLAIEAERDSAIDDLRKEFGELTILAASKIIGESLDKESHKALIDKVLQQTKTLGKDN
jgi:F-type H+-transporting ATPase subunit b